MAMKRICGDTFSHHEAWVMTGRGLKVGNWVSKIVKRIFQLSKAYTLPIS